MPPSIIQVQRWAWTMCKKNKKWGRQWLRSPAGPSRRGNTYQPQLIAILLKMGSGWPHILIFQEKQQIYFLKFLNQSLNFITLCGQNSVGVYTALGFQSMTCYTCETLRSKESRMSLYLGGPLLSPCFSPSLYLLLSSLPLETNLTQLLTRLKQWTLRYNC